MSPDKDTPWIPFNFLALPEGKSNLKNARVVLLPVPYDSTTSYRSGAREGPIAILQASRNLEDYDTELDLDLSDVGIHTAPFLDPHMGGPYLMMQRVREATHSFACQKKIVGLIGGEHSITIGGVRALADLYPGLSVLYLDAHGDLRDQYMGTPWGHATVARRLWETYPLVQVGVRSISYEEWDFIRQNELTTFFWESTGSQAPDTAEIVSLLSPDVYVSIDLDVLDPSIMAAVGTPEPGGMNWHQITSLLRAVARGRRIVGFDVTELSPDEGPTACAYTAAKLVYKLIAYATSPITGDKGTLAKHQRAFSQE